MLTSPRALCLALLVSATSCLLIVPVASLAADEAQEYDSTLFVDDSRARGSLGDELLSLAEAVRLANGSLSLAQLSPEEAQHISGTPGPASVDRIQVDLGEGGRIVADPPASPGSPVIPYLIDNDGDCLDSMGVVISETSAPSGASGTRNAVIVISSGVSIRRFEFEEIGSAETTSIALSERIPSRAKPAARHPRTSRTSPVQRRSKVLETPVPRSTEVSRGLSGGDARCVKTIVVRV